MVGTGGKGGHERYLAQRDEDCDQTHQDALPSLFRGAFFVPGDRQYPFLELLFWSSGAARSAESAKGAASEIEQGIAITQAFFFAGKSRQDRIVTEKLLVTAQPGKGIPDKGVKPVDGPQHAHQMV